MKKHRNRNRSSRAMRRKNIVRLQKCLFSKACKQVLPQYSDPQQKRKKKAELWANAGAVAKQCIDDRLAREAAEAAQQEIKATEDAKHGWASEQAQCVAAEDREETSGAVKVVGETPDQAEGASLKSEEKDGFRQKKTLSDYEKELAEAKRRHEEQVRSEVRAAADPSLYECYTPVGDRLDDSISVFLASRRGRGHEKDNIPCEDFCKAGKTTRGLILTDADGVSASIRSDFGSRAACEEAIELIRQVDAGCEGEEQFVSRLTSIPFRRMLVNRWLAAVMKHAQEHPDGKIDPVCAYKEYATTLMFAVITEHYYVVGSVGDGQILLFNEKMGMKLRLHAPKESSSVRTLAHPNCYREDFQIGKYDRKAFSGVLLSTDGMYDVFCGGNMLYRYARQITERFLREGESLKPFCYTDETDTKREIEISRQRTFDDCSIVLAVDSSFGNTAEDTEKCRADVILTHFEDAMPIGIHRETLFCRTIPDETEYYTVVSPERKMAQTPFERIEGVRFVQPVKSFKENGDVYRSYPAVGDTLLQQCFHEGKLREQNEYTPNASVYTLKVYTALLRCARRLWDAGYALSESAPYLIHADEEGRLSLYPEAIVPRTGERAVLPNTVQQMFSALFGKLACGRWECPVFRLGYQQVGRFISRLDDPSRKLGYVYLMDDGHIALKNASDAVWTVEDGRTVGSQELLPIDSLPQKNGIGFTLPDAYGNTVSYRFIPKEFFEDSDIEQEVL